MNRLLARLTCWVFGHRYEVAQHFTSYSRRVICRECRGDWGMNDDVGAFIPWDAELEGMYRILGKPVLNPWTARSHAPYSREDSNG